MYMYNIHVCCIHVHVHYMLLLWCLLHVVQRLGELFRKLWNPRHFRAHVSPHEMLQAVSSVSKKKFKITKQGTVSVMCWFNFTCTCTVHVHCILKLFYRVLFKYMYSTCIIFCGVYFFVYSLINILTQREITCTMYMYIQCTCIRMCMMYTCTCIYSAFALTQRNFNPQYIFHETVYMYIDYAFTLYSACKCTCTSVHVHVHVCICTVHVFHFPTIRWSRWVPLLAVKHTSLCTVCW